MWYVSKSIASAIFLYIVSHTTLSFVCARQMHFTVSVCSKIVAASEPPRAFVQIVGDALWVQPSLASNVSAFMATHGDLLPPNPNHAFSWNDVGKALRGEAGSNDWTLRTFYVCWCFYFCERETELCDCARITGRSHIGAFGLVSYTCRSLSISIKPGVRPSRHHVSYCILTSS